MPKHILPPVSSPFTKTFVFLLASMALLSPALARADHPDRRDRDDFRPKNSSFIVGPCNPYTQNVRIGHQNTVSTGIACKRNDGIWEVTFSSVDGIRYTATGPIFIIRDRERKQEYRHPTVIYQNSPVMNGRHDDWRDHDTHHAHGKKNKDRDGKEYYRKW
ncbi:MAG: hypothetical protein H6855_07165 [Rhodospirillales bacterium]|nr:hypothetical protein [Rhodospirillales bacterium]